MGGTTLGDIVNSKQMEIGANNICMLTPKWLVRTMRIHEYNVCNIGCACGDSVNILTQNWGIMVDGIDFSEAYIKNAKEKFPIYNFYQTDLKKLPGDFKYNIVCLSNLLENYYNPWDIAHEFSQMATDYMIFLLPFRESIEKSNHLYSFDVDKVPLQIDDFKLVHIDTTCSDSINGFAYQDAQMLLIYSSHKEDHRIAYLSELYQGLQKVDQAIYQSQIVKISEERDSIKEISVKRPDADKQVKEGALESTIAGTIPNTSNEHWENKNLIKQLEDNENLFREAEQQLFILADSKFFQFAHLLFRIKYQLLKGNRQERKKFRTWIWAKLRGKPGDSDHQYNPLFRIEDILMKRFEREIPHEEKLVEKTIDVVSIGTQLTKTQKNILHSSYTKYDVIIFSVIDYDFRYQRPQHFAARFAENGHRVFYINANLKGEFSIEEQAPGLYIVNLCNDCGIYAIYNADWTFKMNGLSQTLSNLVNQYCIRDAAVIVDYPNWLPAALFLRSQYGFRMITDYMDDFTGFLDTTDALVKEYCLELLHKSDFVVASSQFLYDIARQYNERVGMVRNGTEFQHFYQAAPTKNHKRKVVGYYGAVAHWFDRDKVCYLAEHMPECDIVIIGDITEGREQLEAYSNIKLLGEIPYQTLPEHLSYFDVCLIPFDTSTDLIKATNPVKFYEYLSAGKKVVATEIPELEPYKNKFVYMSNDNRQFLDYVKKCLDGTDDLKSFEERIKFGQLNDWQERYQSFNEMCSGAFPKVNIIVLTYNNLKINKQCIESILTKTAYPNYELIIVDNLSTDGTVEYLKELESKGNDHVRIIFNDENLGFAGGNNIGIQSSGGDYYILLNNDTIVTRGWISSLVKHMVNDCKLGMCGPVTNSIGNEAKVACDYSTLEELEEFAYNYTSDHINSEYSHPRTLALFCTIIDANVIKKCGYLDENYKVGMFEDDDYAEAVKSQRYDLAIANDVFIHHFDGSSFKKLEDDRYKKIFEANKAVFEKKWGTKWVMHKYRNGVDYNSPSGKINL